MGRDPGHLQQALQLPQVPPLLLLLCDNHSQVAPLSLLPELKSDPADAAPLLPCLGRGPWEREQGP